MRGVVELISRIVFAKQEIVFARTSPQHKLEIGTLEELGSVRLLMKLWQSNVLRRWVTLLACKSQCVWYPQAAHSDT